MPVSQNVSVVSGVLASAVADSGTFTVAYPSGTSQASFNTGLVGSDLYIIINGNDKWPASSSDMSVAFGASEITVTNSSGVTWAAGSTFLLNLDREDGNDVVVLTVPLPPLATITAADVVTEMRPGIAGYIENVEFVQTIAVTTGGDAADLVLDIDDTEITGGLVALTSAACTPKGKVINGSAITGGNVLTAASKLTVRGESVTAFAEGEGYLNIRIRRTGNN